MFARLPVVAIGSLALVLLAPATPSAVAQQFQDQTSSWFPNPNPDEFSNQMTVVDIEPDGDLDLIVANGGNFSSQGAAQLVRVYINLGTRFRDETSRLAGAAGNYRGVEVGDANGDGFVDLILANDFNQLPALLINNGFGSFTDQTASRLPGTTLSSTRAQFSDIDNDGDLDIYINHGGPVNRFGCGANRIYINDGNGFYTDETTLRHPSGNVCQPMDVIFGDVDNDFDPDVRTGNRGTGNSKLYRNDGTGVFTDISSMVPSDSSTYSYDFGDIDGDGNLDLVGANSGPSNSELLLKGDGTGAFTNVSGQISPNGSGDDNDSKFFDLDNDGDLDLIVAALFQGREKVYINDGNGNFTQSTTIITGNSDASLDVVVADFNNDGRPDIVTAQGEAGDFQNRIYINVTGPADTLPPTIVRTEAVPSGLAAGTEAVVRTTVVDGITSDRGFFAQSVNLEYTVNAGPPNTVAMKWASNALWRGVIPGQPAGAVVEYQVVATDRQGNTGTGTTESFTVAGVPVNPGDVDGDGDADFGDLLLVLGAWGPCAACPEDLNNDGTVGFADVLLVLGNWG